MKRLNPKTKQVRILPLSGDQKERLYSHHSDVARREWTSNSDGVFVCFDDIFATFNTRVSGYDRLTYYPYTVFG